LTTEHTLSQALAYARDRGWRIFPVNSEEKEPLIKKWPEKATTDPELIAYWFRKFPGAGVAIATGPRSQLCVIDCDSEEAEAAFRALGPVPDTLTSETGRGIHLLFSTVTPLPNSASILAPNVDVRCRGGHIIAPPSVHASGKVYTWRNPGTPVAPLPEWLEERIQFPPAKKKPPAPLYPLGQLPPGHAENVQSFLLVRLRNAPDGGKHGTLLGVSMRLAGLVKTGWSDQRTQTDAMLKALLENATPPTDLENAKRTIASAFVKATPETILNLAHTELDLALRFARETNEFKYLGDMSQWLRFTGSTWDECSSPSLQVGEMLNVIGSEPPAPDVEPTKHLSSLRRFRTSRALGAIGGLAGECPEMYLKRRQMNADPFLFNCQNGTMDFRTGKLRPHDPQDLLTLVSPYAFNPMAPCPQWLRALDLYTGNDRDLAAYLQRLTGSCLVRQVNDEQCWLFRGDGSNGKTAFLETVTAVMGPYAKPTTASSLIVRQNEQHTSAIGQLMDAGLAYVEELERGAILDMDKVKRYFTGRSPFLAQLKMRTDWVEIMPTAKLIISSNHDPHFPDSSKGGRRRFIVVPFDQVIPRTVLRFPEKLLKEEGQGILRWLVDGAMAYVRDGLGTCKAVEQRTAQFHADQDPIADFLDECCMVEPGLSSPSRTLWLAYVDYCAQGKEPPMSQKAFSVLLTHKGFAQVRSGKDRQKGRAGLTLKKDLAAQYQSRSMSS